MSKKYLTKSCHYANRTCIHYHIMIMLSSVKTYKIDPDQESYFLSILDLDQCFDIVGMIVLCYRWKRCLYYNGQRIKKNRHFWRLIVVSILTVFLPKFPILTAYHHQIHPSKCHQTRYNSLAQFSRMPVQSIWL